VLAGGAAGLAGCVPSVPVVGCGAGAALAGVGAFAACRLAHSKTDMAAAARGIGM
jgi:hypothetical protein